MDNGRVVVRLRNEEVVKPVPQGVAMPKQNVPPPAMPKQKQKDLGGATD